MAAHPPGRVSRGCRSTPGTVGGLGGPDGLTVDAAGNVFATARERVFVLGADGGLLGAIHPGAITTNAAWGEDGASVPSAGWQGSGQGSRAAGVPVLFRSAGAFVSIAIRR